MALLSTSKVNIGFGMRKLRSILAFILAGSTALNASSASACAMPAEFQIDDIKMADVVVAGWVREYEKKEVFAVINIEVKRQLTGSQYARDHSVSYGDEIQVSWQNSTFQLPDRLTDEERIFALRRTGGKAPPLRAPSGFVSGDPDGYEYTLLQAPCATAFNLPYSTLGEMNIQSILDGGDPLDFDYLNPDVGYVIRIKEMELLLKITVAIVAFLTLIIGALLWRLRSSK